MNGSSIGAGLVAGVMFAFMVGLAVFVVLLGHMAMQVIRDRRRG